MKFALAALISIAAFAAVPNVAEAAQTCGRVEIDREHIVQVAVVGVDCETAEDIGKRWTTAAINYDHFWYLEVKGWHCKTGSGTMFGYCGKPGKGIWILGRGRDPSSLQLQPVPKRPRPAPRPGNTYIENGMRIQHKPRFLILGIRAGMENIHWRRWGSRRAIGYGRFFVAPSVGQPDSAIGPARARITYYHPISCGNAYWVFGRSFLRYGSRLRGFIRFPNNPSPCS